MAIREYAPIESEYYKIFLHSAIEYIKNAAKGIIPGISREDILELLIPIPSYLEQRRIITSVKKTYKYIDIIESSKSNLSTHIKQAKAKVLDLAIRGKLVPQDPTDEPASVLLERIKAEKNATTKPSNRGAKKAASSSPNSHYENVPFEVPDSWVWCTCAEVCDFERGITFPASAKESFKTSNNIACLRTTNVQEEVDLSDLLYISREYINNKPEKLIKENDIIT